MRAPFFCALAFLLGASLNLFAQGTTTASVCHSDGDHAISPGLGCFGSFNGMTFVGTDGSTFNITANNADSTPRELSTVPIQPSGSTMQVFVELQPWFHVDQGHVNYPVASGTNNYVAFDNHVEVGYDSWHSDIVQAQLSDMLTRNLNGVVIDWYSQFGDATENAGPGNMEDMTAGAIKTAFSTNPFCNSNNTLCLHYVIQEDQGAWKRTDNQALRPGCVTNTSTVTQPDQTACIERQLERDFAYMQAEYLASTGYLKISSQPLIQFFVDDGTGDTTWTANFTTVWQAEYPSGKNLGASLVFKGKDGFTHFGGFTDGAFAWPAFSGLNPDPDNSFNRGTVLPGFYNAAAGHTTLQIWGVTYKGFDERTDQSRAPNNVRYINQRCGRTWKESVYAIRNPATLSGGPSGLTVPFGLVSTWNDYGEGTSIEPGIDNCVSAVNASDGGCDASHQCTLNWNTVFSDTTNGTEQTIAEFRVDEVNMITGVQNIGVDVVTPDSNGNFSNHSFTYPDTQFGCDEWFYVHALGLNSVTNHKSNSVDVHCSSGSAQVNGSVQSYYTPDWECAMWNENGDCVDWENYGYYTYDYGTVTVSAMGLSKTVAYDGNSSAQTIAAAVANAFNADPNSQVQATVNGAVVNFRSKHLGPTYNQPLGSSWTWDSADPNFTSPSFTVSTSGLQGGVG